MTHEYFSTLQGIASRIADLADQIDDPTTATLIREVAARSLGDQKLHFVLVGEWNAGKSTLVSALARRPGLVPVDALPTTSYVTLVEPAPVDSWECCRDGVWSHIDQAEFERLVVSAEPDPTIDCLRVRFAIDDAVAFPPDSLLVDTPGLEDVSQARSDMTLRYLPRADAIILAIDAPAGVKGTHKKFVSDLTKVQQRRVVLALTRMDQLNDDDERERKLQGCRSAFADDLPSAEWITTSGYQALSLLSRDPAVDLEATGVPKLMRVITHIARTERTSLLGQRFARAMTPQLDVLDARAAAEAAGLGANAATAEADYDRVKAETADARRKHDAIFAEAKHGFASAVAGVVAGVEERLERLVQQALVDVRELQSLDDVRAFMLNDALGRLISRELATVARDLEERMQSVLQSLGSRIDGVRIAGLESMPNVDATTDSWLVHIPGWAATLIDVVAINPLAPGGVVAALLVKLGLDKLLKGVLPSQWLQRELVAAIEKATHGLPARTSAAMSDLAQRSLDDTLRAIRDSLSRRMDASIAGLDAARSRWSDATASVEDRRAWLSAWRTQLARQRADLMTASEVRR